VNGLDLPLGRILRAVRGRDTRREIRGF
jgi:hypothetical protein